MQVLLINLAKATERLSFQKKQLGALKLNFERVEAVDAKAETTLLDSPYWDTWERPMSMSERACFMSHRQVWKQIAEGVEPVLVLEDDAILSATVPSFLAMLGSAQHIDYVTLETRARKKLLSRQPVPGMPLRRLYQDRSGAAAYVLWPRAAQILLTRTETSAGLADAILCSSYDLAAYQAYPPLAIQADICAQMNIRTPLATHSSIERNRDQRSARKLRFHLRRIRNQTAIGIRRIQNLIGARREMLRLDVNDFAYLAALPD